jgi:DNA-directed RNA polymerase subunit P|tara:strand:+ start:43 stop:279 length:237 start_codon:yes stop_codon:yes gene_type:complete
MVLGSNTMIDETGSELTDTESINDITEDEKFDVIYSCLRCATKVSSTELSRLPEIKCICGFRVFTKVRPPIVKTVKAV